MRFSMSKARARVPRTTHSVHRRDKSVSFGVFCGQLRVGFCAVWRHGSPCLLFSRRQGRVRLHAAAGYFFWGEAGCPAATAGAGL
jgi:hypothetical protein